MPNIFLQYLEPQYTPKLNGSYKRVNSNITMLYLKYQHRFILPRNRYYIVLLKYNTILNIALVVNCEIFRFDQTEVGSSYSLKYPSNRVIFNPPSSVNTYGIKHFYRIKCQFVCLNPHIIAVYNLNNFLESDKNFTVYQL